MYRGCRRWVCSLVCVFSILCMLFLDTCTVEAGNNIIYSFTNNQTISYNSELGFNTSGSISNVSGGGGSLREGSGTILPNGGGGGSITSSKVREGSINYHVRVPYTIINNFSSYGETGDKTKYYKVLFNVENFEITGATISNICFYDKDGQLMYSLDNRPYWDVKIFYGGELFVPENTAVGSDFSFPFYVEYDVSSVFLASDYTYNVNITTNARFNVGLYEASADEVEAGKIQVSDTVGNEHLNEIENSSKAIEESVTSETGGGVLATLKNFFGSFFSNLIGVFVPEDGYFSEWFNKVNTLLSEKLGMLYAPFDLVISTLQAIYSADSTETGIPFPGIQWEDTWLVEPFTFTFASLGSDFDDLRDKVYFATDTVLVLTFLMLLQSKVKLILEGHE